MAKAIFIRADRKDYRIVSNADLIPDVRSGEADFAMPGSDITGEIEDTDWVGLDAEEVDKLRGCEIVFATHKKHKIDLSRTVRIATSYKRATVAGIDVIAEELGLSRLENYQIKRRSGKVEGVVPGLADAVVDIRQSGISLERNGLVQRVSLGQIMLCGMWRSNNSDVYSG